LRAVFWPRSDHEIPDALLHEAVGGGHVDPFRQIGDAVAQVVRHQLPVSVGVLVVVRGEGVAQGVEPAVLDLGMTEQGVEAPAEVGVVEGLAVGVGDVAVVALRLLGLQMLQHLQGRQAQIEDPGRGFGLGLALHVGHAAHGVALGVPLPRGGAVPADDHAAGFKVDVAVFQCSRLPCPQAGVQQKQEIFRLLQLLRRRLDGISLLGFPAQHIPVLHHVPDAEDLLRGQNVDLLLVLHLEPGIDQRLLLGREPLSLFLLLLGPVSGLPDGALLLPDELLREEFQIRHGIAERRVLGGLEAEKLLEELASLLDGGSRIALLQIALQDLPAIGLRDLPQLHALDVGPDLVQIGAFQTVVCTLANPAELLRAEPLLDGVVELPADPVPLRLDGDLVLNEGEGLLPHVCGGFAVNGFIDGLVGLPVPADLQPDAVLAVAPTAAEPVRVRQAQQVGFRKLTLHDSVLLQRTHFVV
jgi:hypothetical protein